MLSILGDKGRLFATIVPCWGELETVLVLDPEPASEEVCVPGTRSAASLTISRAASLSDQLVDRRMSRSSSLSICATSRLQRLPRCSAVAPVPSVVGLSPELVAKLSMVCPSRVFPSRLKQE